MFKRFLLVISVLFPCLGVFSQTLTSTYVQLADSADYYISNKLWSDAERVIIKALKHEPANKSNYLLWSNLGIVRENEDNYEGAVEAYTIGLSSAPKSTVLLTNRARALLSLNHREEALDDLEKALAVDSTLQWQSKMRGVLLASLDEDAQALEALEKYTEKFGNDPLVLETMGDIYGGEGDFDMMIEYYKKSYETEQDSDLLQKMLLTAYAYGKLEDMSEILREGIKKFPRNGTLYLLRAMLNKASYQTDAYESDLKTALNLGVDRDLYDHLTQKR